MSDSAYSQVCKIVEDVAVNLSATMDAISTITPIIGGIVKCVGIIIRTAGTAVHNKKECQQLAVTFEDLQPALEALSNGHVSDRNVFVSAVQTLSNLLLEGIKFVEEYGLQSKVRSFFSAGSCESNLIHLKSRLQTAMLTLTVCLQADTTMRLKHVENLGTSKKKTHPVHCLPCILMLDYNRG
eukprot:TRINITY_DN11965_c0_g1_i1.p2 TRINITY_DN11965_c0_g1~~TRINITY_DN11965_c0_g1_i1.p2  ORF type:complete len:183 (-),score=29.29 TRINITY_DN11965_c0_g1_i1:1364-1912(-)